MNSTQTSSDIDGDTVLAHWGEYVDGGGERVAWDMHRVLDAPLYVAHQDENMEPDDVDTREFNLSRLQRWALDHGGLPRLFVHQDMWQLRPELRSFDILVTSGNEPLAYVPPDSQTWVAYMHHTSRPATDLLQYVISQTSGRFARTRRQSKKWVRWAERQVYSNYSSKPTRYVANSELVARRINQYWGVPKHDIAVVYPPVDTETWHPDNGEDQGYYLTWSRHRPEKNIGAIVKAFNELDSELVVAGSGCETERLEDMADDNIRFTGWVPDQEIRRMAAEAKAVVFAAKNEDFGLVPIEAMASGTPVIGVKDGFTQYQIKHEQTGYLFDKYRGKVSPLSIQATVRDFETRGVEWDSERIADWARKKYGKARFKQELTAEIKRAHTSHQLQVNHESR